jgi:hypothetical protein
MRTCPAYQTEDEVLNDEVSDESLEFAADSEQTGAYTISFCTSDVVCPA